MCIVVQEGIHNFATIVIQSNMHTFSTKTKRYCRILFLVVLLGLFNTLAFSQQKFTPDAIKADIDSLVSTILKLHPAPFERMDSTLFVSKIQNLKSSIKEPRSANELYLELAPIVSELKDGHTSLMQGDDYNIQKLIFPILIYIKNGRMFVRKDCSGNNIVVGSEIIEINHESAKKVVKNLLQYHSGEFLRFKQASLEATFPYSYKKVYGENSNYTVKIKKKLCKTSEYDLNSIDIEKYNENHFFKPSTFYIKDDVAVYDLRNFYAEDFKEITDSLFAEISRKGAKNLIIDIRKNGGGNSELGDYLLSYLTKKKYRQFDAAIMNCTAKDSYVEMLKEAYPHMIDSLNRFLEKQITKQGNMYVMNIEYAEQREQKNFFEGNIYLLTSHSTYSSAAAFAATFKCYRIGTVVGQETGQPSIASGNIVMYRLPNTGLQCGISNMYYVMACGNSKEHGILPDFAVTESERDIINGKDTALEFVLSNIKKRAK